MRMRHECVPCLLNRVIYEAGLVDPKFSEKAVKEALNILSKEYSYNANSILVATKVHRRVYEIIENPDPYREIKERSNRIALSLVPKAEKFINNSKDKLKAAVICSIVGNVFDFGIKSSIAAPEKLENDFEKMCKNGLDVDDTEKIKKYLKKNSKVLFFTDNCGEIVFDKLLCRQLKKFGVELTIVVRESPIMNDATVKDAEKLGLKDAVDEIMHSSNAVGIDFNEISDELKNRIENADLIMCKGMGMYEAFCEKKYRPIAYLLRTKCRPVADDMGLPENISAAKLYE
ncbi:MAG: ARMT1-like domain-containing protein [Thermoplasmatales archaeon]|nr:ARMT1-like domain-containing protein [Thermoplasmatales archaeon]